MTPPPDDLDPDVFARVMAGEASANDQHLVDQWAAVDPKRRLFLESVAQVLRGQGRPRDRDAAWSRIARQLPVERPMSLHAGRKPRLSPWVWSWGLVGAIAVAVIAVVGRGRPGASRMAFREFATTPGNQSTVTLRDGTKITLGPATRLHVPTDFGSSATRTVELDGAAYFAVVHDATQPFIVRTAHAVVQDVGTVFVVQAYPDEPTEAVAVAEGEVRVGTASLRAHDIALVDHSGGLKLRRSVDVSAFLAWPQGRLVFDATPLPDVARQLGRTFDLDIRLADSALTHDAVTAAFDHESADQVLMAVTAALGAQYERHGRTVVIRRHGSTPAVRPNLSTR